MPRFLHPTRRDDAGGGAGRLTAPVPPQPRRQQDTTERGYVSVVSMRELLEAGVHFGHQTRRWNPKMRRFIFTERGGIYIIDLQQTLELLEEAHDFARNVAERNGTMLFVGTKKQARTPVAEHAEARRHAVREPPLARRAAHELAHDLRPDRPPARAAPAEGGGPARPAARRRSGSAMLAELEKLEANLGGVADMRASRTRSSSSTCARSSSPCARRAGWACR